jgi:ribose transport system substrate-binding protein
MTPDVMGAGVVKAIESAGKNPEDFSISGFCLGPEVLEYIKEGKVKAVVPQWTFGPAKLAVNILYKMCRGEEVPKLGDVIVEEGVEWSPAEVIENHLAEGLFIKLSSLIVPAEMSVDDDRLWENHMDELAH